MISPVKYIILHHSATEDSGTVSWNAIRKYHIHNNRWIDIGYHFGIEDINGTYEILKGRPMFKYGLFNPGAHTKGFNYNSIGICCVGNYDVLQPDSEMQIKLIELLRDLCKIFSLPRTSVKGHRDFLTKDHPKKCPGKLFDIHAIRKIL